MQENEEPNEDLNECDEEEIIFVTSLHKYMSPLNCADCKDLFTDEKDNRRSSDMPFLCETCSEYRRGGY